MLMFEHGLLWQLRLVSAAKDERPIASHCLMRKMVVVLLLLKEGSTPLISVQTWQRWLDLNRVIVFFVGTVELRNGRLLEKVVFEKISHRRLG